MPNSISRIGSLAQVERRQHQPCLAEIRAAAVVGEHALDFRNAGNRRAHRFSGLDPVAQAAAGRQLKAHVERIAARGRQKAAGQ
jgi:hypothetical protein